MFLKSMQFSFKRGLPLDFRLHNMYNFKVALMSRLSFSQGCAGRLWVRKKMQDFTSVKDLAISMKRVAVIGAGVSGLTSIKSCQEEGFDVVCFEKSSDIGGLWNYSPDSSKKITSVARNTVTNTSKEMMAFSDFPMPEDYPNFPSHSQVLEHLKLYADTFDLRKCVGLNTIVTKVELADDHETWNLTSTDLNGENKVTETFHAIAVCTGFLAKPNMVHFKGSDDFQGEIIHAASYRCGPAPYAGKKVLVVGTGPTSFDTASEVCTVASEVFICSRSGKWLTNRFVPNRLPFDLAQPTRFLEATKKVLPSLACKKLEDRADATLGQTGAFHHRPTHEITQQFPQLSEDIPKLVMSGQLKVKPEVSHLAQSSVHFVDGSCVKDVDVIVLGTGYEVYNPYLGDISRFCDKRYHFILPTKLPCSTLGFIGRVETQSLVPVFEMQARWFARHLKGCIKTPSPKEFKRTMRHQGKEERWYLCRDAANRIGYMDLLAAEIGCSPNIGEFLLTDPKLAKKLIFGPHVSYQYRLRGPHKWDGARETIISVMKRVRKPLNI